MAKWPPPTYRFRTEFPVPLDYAYRWCTDYQPDDGARSKETYERRVIRRTARTVVYEDLWWEKDGWRWRRYRVALHPPDRWTAEGWGNVRDVNAAYVLSELPGNRTRLDLTLRRRPHALRPSQPTPAAMQKDLGTMWGNFGVSMVRDYRSSSHRRSKPTRR